MLFQLLIDNKNSWMCSYINEIHELVSRFGFDFKYIKMHEEVVKGDVLLLLSCEKKFTQLELNSFNLVVHESPLPLGKGWSPLTWQVLEGKNTIPICLIDAHESIDSGDIYEQINILLDGNELVDELREKQVNATISLIQLFLMKYPKNIKTPQKGTTTFYPKRSPKDSMLDLTKSLEDQFQMLRVSDNERYPAYFIRNGHTYILKIYKKMK